MSRSALQRLTLVVLVLVAPAARAEPVRGTYLLLRWTASPGAAGYRLYAGEHSHHYTNRRDLQLQAANTVDGVVHVLLPAPVRGRRHFFAVTAYNAAGESGFSNEKEIIGGVTPPRADAGADQKGKTGQTFLLGTTPEPGTQYFWLQRAGPPATVVDRTSSQTSFVPRGPGIFQFVVVAYDVEGIASIAWVRILVANSSPSFPPPAGIPVPDFCASGDDAITVGDLLIGVGIALGTRPLADCAGFDFNGDGVVTVDDVVTGVSAALNAMRP